MRGGVHTLDGAELASVALCLPKKRRGCLPFPYRRRPVFIVFRVDVLCVQCLARKHGQRNGVLNVCLNINSAGEESDYFPSVMINEDHQTIAVCTLPFLAISVTTPCVGVDDVFCHYIRSMFFGCAVNERVVFTCNHCCLCDVLERSMHGYCLCLYRVAMRTRLDTHIWTRTPNANYPTTGNGAH